MAPTIFFIPGAWHKPWVFDTVRSVLSDRGYETDALELATAGSEDAAVGVLDDTAKIRNTLSKIVDAGEDVLVVAHSYGGVPTSSAVQGLSKEQRAAEGKPGGIIMLLYLAAFTCPAGSTLLQALGGVFPDFWNVQVSTSAVLLWCSRPKFSTKPACCLFPGPCERWERL